ncbi:MAG: hypothetical protein ACLQVJ_16045 [Syntrophobacteraceae bacterium]
MDKAQSVEQSCEAVAAVMIAENAARRAEAAADKCEAMFKRGLKKQIPVFYLLIMKGYLAKGRTCSLPRFRECMIWT